MSNLFDHLKWNNTLYKDLTNEEDKAKVEKFVEYIKKVGLEELILSFNPSYQFNARWFDHNGQDFVSNFPQDLYDKLMVLWIKLDEPKPLEAYRQIYPV